MSVAAGIAYAAFVLFILALIILHTNGRPRP